MRGESLRFQSKTSELFKKKQELLLLLCLDDLQDSSSPKTLSDMEPPTLRRRRLNCLLVSLGLGIRPWFLLLKFSPWILLVILSQAYLKESRCLYSWELQNLVTHSKRSRWMKSSTVRTKNMCYFLKHLHVVKQKRSKFSHWNSGTSICVLTQTHKQSGDWVLFPE